MVYVIPLSFLYIIYAWFYQSVTVILYGNQNIIDQIKNYHCIYWAENKNVQLKIN